MAAHQLVIVQLDKRTTPTILLSLANGFLSGVFELGAALAVIVLMKNKFIFDYQAILCFGLGIGSFETLIVAFSSDKNLLEGTALEKTSQEIFARLRNVQGIKRLIYHYIYRLWREY
ncbi:MAG: hypothetical protein Kow0042_24610 [Calditrichia bacterium]